jgi:hypothetical protein
MKRLVYLAVLALPLAACGRDTGQTKEPTSPPAATATPYKIDISTKDLMKHAVDPSADIVWAASGYVVDEKGTTDLSPKTPEGWTTVENNAAIVAELSNTLMLPGRSPEEPKWNGFANRLHDTAMAAMHAAQIHDKAGLLHTGSDMFLACTACHKYYVLGEKN